MRCLPHRFFEGNPVDCARDLIGCRLAVGPCVGRIIETEAYAAVGDEACHTFRRPSARRFVAEHLAGTAYVYMNYGMHWLFNVLVKPRGVEGREGFVLVRAVEPLRDLQGMKVRRKTTDLKNLCSGPGKLAQAFGIDGSHHGISLCGDKAFCLMERDRKLPEPVVIADVRVGISLAMDLPWRFLEADNPMVSVRKRGVVRFK